VDWEGAVLGGKYTLQQCVLAEENGSAYLTEVGPEQKPAIARVVVASPEAGEQARTWQIAARLHHPNLLECFETGRGEFHETPFIYAVLERPDEKLSAVLKDRPLSEREATDVLEAVLGALEFLHGRRLVHGGLDTENIFAVGETVKLSNETLRPFGDSVGSAPADDVWRLGLSLQAMLAGPNPPETADFSPVLGSIIDGCLRTEPRERWTLARIRQALAPPQSAVAPVETVSAPPAAPEQEKRKRITVSSTWLFAGAGVLLSIGLIAWFASGSKPTRHDPAPAVARTSPPAAPVPARPKPSPLAHAKPPVVNVRTPVGSSDALWRVVVYTFSRPADAEAKARTINERHPDLNAEVFTPKGEHRYLVAIGGWMQREDAVRLQREAVSQGLPPDSYAQNFRR
jgi:serine/threonine protein kinase